MAHSRLVKLVRDRVGEKLAHSTVIYAPILMREQAIKELRKKLIEEAIEYIENPCIEELADVYEVFRALCEHDLNIDTYVVREMALDKRDDRGGFDKLIGMYVAVGKEA